MYIPTQKTLTVGGRTFTSDEVDRMATGTTGIILLAQNGTSGRGTNFRTYAGVDYVVPTGKTLKALAARTCMSLGTAIGTYALYLGRSDAAVSYDTASPGTSPVYYGGASIPSFITSEKMIEFSLYWEVAASKYPFMYSGGGGACVILYCLID